MKGEHLWLVFQRGEIAPPMHYRRLIDFGNAAQDARFQLLPTLDPHPAQKRPSHFAEQRFHQVQPGTVLGRMHIHKPVRARGQVGHRLLRDVRRVIVQHDADRALGRVEVVEILE